jgi:choline-sulfatase
MPDTQRPNILLICSDEYRGDMIACNGQNPDIRTPHIDGLAARGVNFRQHFCSFPKCVPSRVSMMTGRYTHTDGYRNIHQLMPHGTPDLASTLQNHGYELIELGRNHCWEHMLAASHDPPTLQPGQRGIAFDHHAWTAPFKPIWEKHLAEHRQLTEQHLEGLERGEGFVRCDNQKWGPDLAITEQVEHFLEHVREPDRPFFCQLNYGNPHPGYEVDQPWFSMYDTDGLTPLPRNVPDDAPYCVTQQRAVRTGDAPEGLFRAVQTTYMGMCSRIDQLVGRVLAAVDRLGLADDTVVIFTSDHGDYAGQYGLVEKWDTHFADCLMQVPMVIAGPGLDRGTTVESLTSHVDLAPTLCELVGIDPFAGVHGTSLLPTLGGERVRDAVFGDGGHEPEMRRRFNHYDGQHPTPAATPDHFKPRPDRKAGQGNGKQETYRLFPDTMARAKMVRTDRWKYVHRQTGDHELYDLHADRWELHNLFPTRPAGDPVINDLRSRLLDWSLATDTDRPHQEKVGA